MGKTRRPTSKRAATKVRKTATEKAPADVTRQYARILGEHGAVDRRLSDVIRVCLRAIAQRLPLGSRIHREAEALLERVIRLGELGVLDLIGTAPAIAAHIAATLHEEPLDPRSVYRVLKALHKQTSLVDHPSRIVWTLRLSGLCDPSSPLHRALLAETPSPYHLSEQSREVDAPPREPLRQDPLVALRAELVELRRGQAEDRRRLARVEAELAALREQLVRDGAALVGSPELRSQPVEAELAARELDAPSSTREDPLAAEVLPLTQVDHPLQDAQVSPVEDVPLDPGPSVETDRPGPTVLAEVPPTDGAPAPPMNVIRSSLHSIATWCAQERGATTPSCSGLASAAAGRGALRLGYRGSRGSRDVRAPSPGFQGRAAGVQGHVRATQALVVNGARSPVSENERCRTVATWAPSSRALATDAARMRWIDRRHTRRSGYACRSGSCRIRMRH